MGWRECGRGGADRLKGSAELAGGGAMQGAIPGGVRPAQQWEGGGLSLGISGGTTEANSRDIRFPGPRFKATHSRWHPSYRPNATSIRSLHSLGTDASSVGTCVWASWMADVLARGYRPWVLSSGTPSVANTMAPQARGGSAVTAGVTTPLTSHFPLGWAGQGPGVIPDPNLCFSSLLDVGLLSVGSSHSSFLYFGWGN